MRKTYSLDHRKTFRHYREDPEDSFLVVNNDRENLHTAPVREYQALGIRASGVKVPRENPSSLTLAIRHNLDSQTMP